MSFNPNIPQAADDPSVSQGQLLTNFQQLNLLFNVDHVTWNDTTAADRGEHSKITLNDVLGGDPGLASPKSSVYTKADSGGSSQLFFENFDVPGAANIVRQLTNLTATNVGTNYGITTPWGLIFNWGQFTCNTGDTTLTYAVTFNAPPQTIQLTAISDNGARNAVVRVSNAATATCRATNNGLQILYFAVGV